MKVCKYLFNEINFISSRIVPCCSKNLEDEELIKKYFIRPNENTTAEILNEYFEKRQKYIQMFKNGIVPTFCQNCNEYQGIETTTDLCFEKIYINNKSQCNCRCTYCCLAGENNTEEDFARINREKTYNIAPILEELENKKLINSNTSLCLCGGEPTLHSQDIEYIIEYAKRNDNIISLFTNGIIYNESFANFLSTNKSEICCSLDSASRKMYKKIKRVDLYDKVINNLKNYSIAAKDNPKARVRLKYIICPGINDNIIELKKFFDLATSINATGVILSIDRFWFKNNINKKPPKKLIKCIKYFTDQNHHKNLNKNIEYTMLHKDYVYNILKQKTFFEQFLKKIKNVK